MFVLSDFLIVISQKNASPIQVAFSFFNPVLSKEKFIRFLKTCKSTKNPYYRIREKQYKRHFFHTFIYYSTMVNRTIKDKIAQLFQQYQKLSKANTKALHEIAINEIPEIVYNSNAIENSTLTLKDTEEILIYDQIKKDYNLREVYEAKNLANITEKLLKAPDQKLTIELILTLHKSLLTGIKDDRAGRFRSGKERVQV